MATALTSAIVSAIDADVNAPRVVTVTSEPAVPDTAVMTPLGALLPLPLMNAADSAKSIDSPISPGNCASRFESWKISNEPVTYAVSIAASTVTPPVVGNRR